jgi:hypothetical protein
MENDAKIFPVHYTWKVTEKGLNIASKMNNLAMIILVKLFLKNKINFFCQKSF